MTQKPDNPQALGVMIDYREKAIDGLIAELAHGDMGIYCKESSGGKRPYEKRNAYMEGWNAYSTELFKKQLILTKWLESLGEHRTVIEDYLLTEKLQISVSGETVSLWVCCNDLFWWACADGECFQLADLADFQQALLDSSKYGDVLWCCRKRKMRPQTPYYRSFSDEERALFDACGPERKKGEDS